MRAIKRIIRSLTPSFLISLYHISLAYLGALWNGFPSHDMVVIGVTGTRGKTTAGNLIWSALTASGYVAGLTGTANIRIGSQERMNPFHMTMPGRFKLQKILREMRDAGCQFAIIESPSEGIEQWRHKGVAYDALLLTTLYPEYIAAHRWSYERCKDMHVRLFSELYSRKVKYLNGKKVPKIIVVNGDLPEKKRFLSQKADIKVTFGFNPGSDFRAENITVSENSTAFQVGEQTYALKLKGEFNVLNALAAISLLETLEIKQKAIQKGLLLPGVPGRMEEISSDRPFRVFVDYAHDAVSLKAALEAARSYCRKNKLIVLTGGQGGGRDRKKLPIMGKHAAQMADFVIVANEDPYSDDPIEIMEAVAQGAETAGKTRGENLFFIEDRREGIRKALSLAMPGDVVLIAGKGAEQSMETSAGQVPWDDRKVVREELAGIG